MIETIRKVEDLRSAIPGGGLTISHRYPGIREDLSEAQLVPLLPPDYRLLSKSKMSTSELCWVNDFVFTNEERTHHGKRMRL